MSCIRIIMLNTMSPPFANYMAFCWNYFGITGPIIGEIGATGFVDPFPESG
jgi:hypothetical protein